MSSAAAGRIGGLILLALLVALAAGWTGATVALGAEPSASPAAILEAGDPRSDGGAAGLVGSPLMILLGVVALGLLTALVTALIERLTRRARAG